MKRLLVLTMVCLFAFFNSLSAQSTQHRDDVVNPLKSVVAEEIDATQVAVSWSTEFQSEIEDFETGDFSSFDWNNTVSYYPWVVTSNAAHSGQYSMKSACEGIDNSISAIEIEVDMPATGYIGFYYKILCEGIGDFGRFYVDGTMRLNVIGDIDWTYAQFEVSEGTHTLRWEYEKDFMASWGDDAFYIDDINFFIEKEPFTGGWLHYDDGVYVENLGAGEPLPIYWAVSYPASEEYAGYSVSKLSVYDSQNSGVVGSANVTAEIYLGGEDAPGTLVATKDFTFTGSNNFKEVVLDSPVTIDGTQPFWFVISSDELSYPAAGCAYIDNPNSDWISLDSGATWNHASSDYNLMYTWMIRAFLDNAKGETVALALPKNSAKYDSDVTASTLVATNNAKPVYVGVPVNKSEVLRDEVSSYNVYRKNIYGTEEFLVNTTDTTHIDNTWGNAEVGVYHWGVSAVYEEQGSTLESPILWSRPLDKDMVTSVTVNVETNSGDPAKGTVITFTNLVEEDVVITTQLGDANSYTWNDFRKGEYELTVSKIGYTSDTEAVMVEIWEESDFDAFLTEILGAIEDLYVSPTGWAMWKTSIGDEFSYDFEDGMQGWTNIDADGDSNVWVHETGLGGHSGAGIVLSESFNNDMGVLYPDNYLVSPEKVNIGSSSKFTFWACAQDENYPYEHFGVAVSTTGNTSASNFTTIVEWTLTAKSADRTAERGSRGQGAWYQFEVDLSEYAGLEVWLAIRHFDCYDQFYLNVDDVELINADNGSRALTNYEIMLNGIVENDELTVPYYQHLNLTDGSEYTTTVVASYTMGDSEQRHYTWMKAAESNFAAVEEFAVSFDNDAAQLTWTLPESNYEILGVMISRNGEVISGKPIAGTSYLDGNGAIGDEYCVRVVYGGEMNVSYYAMSAPVCDESTYTIPCDAPEKLYGEYTCSPDGTFGTTLHLSYSVGEWLHYDDGVNLDGVGGPGSFYWGVMFPADMLAAYEGSSLTKVSLFAYAQTSGDLNIYYGGSTSPGELIHTQLYAVAATSKFEEIELTSALPIDPSTNIWVVFSTAQGGSYPASTCMPVGNPNARWISMDGIVWEDMMIYGMDVTWMIRAYAEQPAKGEISSLTPITDYEYTASTGEIVRSGVAKDDAFDHYNIYRSTTNSNYELIGESTGLTYHDDLTDVGPGTYYYQVTAFYSKYDEECESDPATAYGDETQDYVVVEVTSIEENGVNGMMIYPNPTQGNMTIMAEAMTRISIINTLGQVVYDQAVATDNTVINMSQFDAGIYMVRITTETGVAVERVTVVR